MYHPYFADVGMIALVPEEWKTHWQDRQHVGDGLTS